ncbi:MAG: aldehyde dehydrogenase family protein [Planctomycetes bacterium]|nr:aldehyde dehydrogenase family protein [Planctomycetota bacterium]
MSGWPVEALSSSSPWDAADRVWHGHGATPEIVDAALVEAESAFPAWAADATRRERLQDFAVLLADRRDDISALLVREAGKVRADAEAEADLLVKKISVTLDQGLARTPDRADANVRWRARGVAAVLGPYNFPLHLLHGLVVPALAVGCTVVAKPSERCPALGDLYGQLLIDAGLDHVCCLVQGGHAVASELVGDARVRTVAAVGSRGMGRALAGMLADRPETVLALELGGVNHAIVCEDADLDAAIAAIADGAWRMAGQRCTATRVAHLPVSIAERALALLNDARQRWVPTPDPGGTTGPMIDARQREDFQRPYRALPEGFELIGGSAGVSPLGSCFAEPLLIAARTEAARADERYVEEHFGPALIVDTYVDLDECLARAAANPYRLAASVFTDSRERFLACAARLPYGQVNHNRPTAGARSDLPFGGCGLSGNGRPAAVAACAIFADETVVW